MFAYNSINYTFPFTGFRYNITHFYCLAVEACFYSDVVEYLPVDPATWVRFPAGAGKIFTLFDNHPLIFVFALFTIKSLSFLFPINLFNVSLLGLFVC